MRNLVSDQLNQGNPFIVSAIRSWPCLSTKSRGVASFNLGVRLHMSPAVSPLFFFLGGILLLLLSHVSDFALTL